MVLLLFGLLIGARAASSDGEANARKTVAHAIQAIGGQDTLARYKARTWTEQAVYHGADGDEQYEASYCAKWPDTMRIDIGDFTMVVIGDEGWIRASGETRDMTREELEEHREGIYSIWVFSLLPLNDTAFKLSPLSDTIAAGVPVAGINVSRRGHLDIQLSSLGCDRLPATCPRAV